MQIQTSPIQKNHPSLKGRALRLLASREHSKQELIKKLKAFAASERELEEVLAWLEGKGYINEQRVLDSVVYRRSALVGFASVARELKEKGLDESAIEQAISELKDTEAERAKLVLEKKFKVPAQTPQEKAKQMRFMLSRGFAPSVLYRLIGGEEE